MHDQKQEQLFKIIFDKDEVTWQRLLYELVKTEGMDPWDVDISALSQRYIDIIKKLKEMDFRISGKVLLAAAILLKIKSNKLLNEDLSDFDRLLTEVDQDELPDQLDLEDAPVRREAGTAPPLIPRTPQPRKRKVSIYDLVNALDKALEVKKRRVLNSIPPLNLEPPKRTRDITLVIRDVYAKIKQLFIKEKRPNVTFTELTPSKQRDDKIFTFIPLLHLSNQQKIHMKQERAFSEIHVRLGAEKEQEEEKAEA